jgi:hypothetical protein
MPRPSPDWSPMDCAACGKPLFNLGRCSFCGVEAPKPKHQFLKGLLILLVPIILLVVLAKTSHGFAGFMALVSLLTCLIALITTIFARKGLLVFVLSLFLFVMFVHFFNANMSSQEKVELAAKEQTRKQADQKKADELKVAEQVSKVQSEEVALFQAKEKAKENIAAAIALEAEGWVKQQVAPFVPAFDCPALEDSNVCASSYKPKWDDDGGLHERVGFTLMSGNIHRTAWCYLRPKHFGQPMTNRRRAKTIPASTVRCTTISTKCA